jgi:hypothetical protein
MGKMIYGPRLEFDFADERSLFHLDVLLTRIRDTGFQLHVTVGGPDDGNLLSLRVGPSTPLVLEYFNGPEIELDLDVIAAAERRIVERGFVTLPFDFDGILADREA